MVSLSGENFKMVEFAKRLKLKDVRILSITQFKDNTLASLSDENIYISTVEIPIFTEYNYLKYQSITCYFIAVELLFLRYQRHKREKKAREIEAGL